MFLTRKDKNQPAYSATKTFGNLGLLVTLVLVSCPLVAFGTTSAQVLEITLDARTNAMAGAAVANADHASSIYYNPAGLYSIPKPEILASFRNEFEDVNSGNVFLALPFKNLGVLGISLFSLHAGVLDLPNVDPDPIAELDFVFAAAWALDLNKPLTLHFPLAVGLTAKYFHSILAEQYTGQAIAFDIGITAPLVIEGISLGLALKNVGPPITYDIESEGLPTSLSAGLSWHRKLITDFSLCVNVDYAYPFHAKGLLFAGAEVLYQKLLQLRLGYRFFHDSSNLTAGFGVSLAPYSVDYAFLNNTLAAKHVITVSYQIPAPKPAPVISMAAKSGLQHFRQGNLVAAKQAWQTALQQAPEDVYVNKYLTEFAAAQESWIQEKAMQAQEYFASGQYVLAKYAWQEIIHLESSHPLGRQGLQQLENAAAKKVQRAKTWTAVMLWVEALSALSEALDILPNFQAALTLRKQIIAEIRQEEKNQKRLLQQAAEKSEQLAKQGKPMKAFGFIEQALAVAPQAPLLLRTKASIPAWSHAQAQSRWDNKRLHAALKIWQQILKVDPNYLPAKKAYQSSEKYFSKKVNAQHQIAVHSYQKKEYQQSIAQWKKVYALDPENDIAAHIVRAYLAQGILYFREDKVALALDMWQKGLTFEPDNKNLQKNIQRAKNKLKFLKNLGWETTP
jgi:tetratricopeptide (TPR) repeat protein